jgi:succinylglutamate desuccinylase
MQEFAAIRKNLAALISGEAVETRPFNNKDFNLFRVKTELIKKSEDFKLNIADNVENFTEFKHGFVLAEDSQGNYVVEQDGEAIVFPNASVPVGQRAGLIVIRTEI